MRLRDVLSGMGNRGGKEPRKSGKKRSGAEQASFLGKCRSEPGVGVHKNEGLTLAAWGEGNLLPLATLDCSGQDTTPPFPCSERPRPNPRGVEKG